MVGYQVVMAYGMAHSPGSGGATAVGTLCRAARAHLAGPI